MYIFLSEEVKYRVEKIPEPIEGSTFGEPANLGALKQAIEFFIVVLT